MGTALYPVLEKKIEGFDPSVEVSGRALARHSDMIDATCKELGIKTLWDFYDESPEEVEAHLAEPLTAELEETLRKETLKWSDASEGIAVIQALRTQLAQNPTPHAQAVIEDLNALERVLDRAAQENTRFRLAIDM
jgi:hypothetical protein